MELLNLAFAILILKITLCVLPGIFGIFLIFSSQSSKRRMRSKVCSRLFGISDAIRTRKFTCFLYVLGMLSMLFSLTAIWVFVLRAYV
jgi:hypothetical protein